jgi:methylmalonyl-CoA/ethylmalonyl-CoA epimerase
MSGQARRLTALFAASAPQFVRLCTQSRCQTQPLALTSLRSLSTREPSDTFQVGRLNHIAIAVPNLDEASARFADVFGAKVSPPQTLPEHGVRVVFVALANTKLELLEPLGDASPIANFLKKNPSGGMHHMCLEVPDIQKAVAHVSATPARLLDPKPKIGAHGTPVVFLHPKDMCGVLTEMEEVK